jgi:transcriptional regulator with XRE-family HTH domain
MPPRRKSTPRSREHAALGEALRRRRAELGWTQEELADQAHTDLRQIGGIERGTRNPSYLTLVRLAGALRVRPGELVTLADRVLDEGETEGHLAGPASAQTASTSRSQSGSTPRVQP